MNHTRATFSIALAWEGEESVCYLCVIMPNNSCLDCFIIYYQVWQPSRPDAGCDGPGKGSEADPGAPSMGGVLPWPAQAQYGAMGHILSSNAHFLKAGCTSSCTGF